MKKNFFLTIFILILIISLSVAIYLFLNKKNELENNSLDNSTYSGIFDSNSKNENPNDRLDTLKKKIALKGLLTKGDLYFENMEYTTALTQYLQVYKEVPNDRETNLKIGDIYYNLNKYDKAYEYYSNIKNYQNLDKTKAVLSLINSTYNGTGSLEKLYSEIDSIGLNKPENFYYKNSLICINDFSKCRANFQETFDKNTTSGTGSIYEDSKNLKTVNGAFINYYNFKIDDLTYKAALVAGAFYQNGTYLIALETAKSILKTNINYKPMLKIAAKSAYELGLYKEAKDYLIEYNKIESNDAEASYFLARIYEKLNDKILSSIHYNKAIKIGYPDLNDIRRRLIFIYFELNETEKMLSTFKDLIDSKDEKLNINDYNLAIYYNILNNELATALKYSEIAKLKYPDSELFYGYQSWIMLQSDNISDYQFKTIENNINKALEINDKSSMITMVKGIFEFKKENYDDAFITFKKAITLDKNNEYSETTKYWLEQIPKK
ncbi:MAG: hypothetical protein PHH98_03365 [Candidatus Gracilibacteria bacterium]|nr:hypothetical protein [Candidatus Gracilibacteria bacterium]